MGELYKGFVFLIQYFDKYCKGICLPIYTILFVPNMRPKIWAFSNLADIDIFLSSGVTRLELGLANQILLKFNLSYGG